VATVLCHVNIVSRGSGRSAVAAAAYRGREKIKSAYDGRVRDYSSRTDLVFAEILLPANAPERLANRAVLWNEVEGVEKQSNAQLARQVEFALPIELTRQQNIALARDMAERFVREGMVADLCIHDDETGNPHAHVMLTMRPLNQDGTWGAKSRKEYILDEDGQRIKLTGGRWKSRKVNTVDWDNRENVEKWRKWYADITNQHLARNGHQIRIDHRSFKRQGIARIPTVRLTKYEYLLEQQGIQTETGNFNRQVQEDNIRLDAINRELDRLQKEGAGQRAGEEVPEADYENLYRQQPVKWRPVRDRKSRSYSKPSSQPAGRTHHVTEQRGYEDLYGQPEQEQKRGHDDLDRQPAKHHHRLHKDRDKGKDRRR
jgi:ATP-dependent exoDNAse (exonuclease V) alpha subunit